MQKAKGSAFDHLVMNMLSDNWTVEAQMGDTVILEKNVGINGWIGTLLIFILGLFGTIGVMIWIATGGKKKVTLQRNEVDYLADVQTKDFIGRINDPYELQPLLQKMQSGFLMSYGMAMGISAVMFIVYFVIGFVLGLTGSSEQFIYTMF